MDKAQTRFAIRFVDNLYNPFTLPHEKIEPIKSQDKYQTNAVEGRLIIINQPLLRNRIFLGI